MCGAINDFFAEYNFYFHLPFYTMRKFVLSLFLILNMLAGHATHIVGGFISYRYLSGTTYRVTLTIYRDCNSATPFDGSPGSTTDAIVGLFANGSSFPDDVLSLTNPQITQILAPTNNPCLQTNSNVCVEQGVYTTTVTLPSANTGYTLIHERCCRNGSVNNIFNPGDQGAVYSAYIPPTNPFQNSSPTFNNLPPLFVCVNAPLVFDYSASDVDNDVLRYSLCTPSNGGTPTAPAPNPPAGPPYQDIPWESGYSQNNMLGGSQPLVIDSITGVLTGTPPSQGQFVVGVCVSEYRNGVLISTYLRDYQLNVTQCNIPIGNIPSTNIDPVTGIGTYVIACNNTTVTFQNNTYNPPPTSTPLDFEWDFGDPTTTSDISTQQFPTYTYPDTGTYLVTLRVNKGSGSTGCGDTTFAFVKIYSSGNSNFSNGNTCPGAPMTFIDQSTTPYGTVTEWLWLFGDSLNSTSTQQNPANTYLSPGIFNVTLISTNSFGCKDTLVKSVVVFEAGVSNFSYTPPCIFQPVTFTSTQPAKVAAYSWTFSDGTNSTSSNPTFTYTNPGIYPVKLVAQSQDGCIDSTTKLIEVQTAVTAVVDSATNACVGFPVQLNASGGLYYSWSPPDDLSDPLSASPVTQLVGNTTYQVIVSNDCFADTAFTTVIVRPIPTVNAGNDTTIYRDTYVLLSGSTDGINYFWNPSKWIDEPFNLNSKAQPEESTWYELFATNEWGCSNKDSVLITVIPYDILDVPTGFSPNGDGVNDVFRIARWLNVARIDEFAVYNRWGQKVFSTTNIEEGWNGTYKNERADLGVYVWFLSAQTKDGKQVLRKGNVTLLR
jgi:gliding motility-associated-like protein